MQEWGLLKKIYLYGCFFFIYSGAKKMLIFLKNIVASTKVIYPKYSKHWFYTLAHKINCVCNKMLNHGLDHGFFLSLFKLTPFPVHWIVCVLAYLNFIFEFKAVLAKPKTARSAQTHKNIIFNRIVWSTLYVYLWLRARMPMDCVIIVQYNLNSW